MKLSDEVVEITKLKLVHPYYQQMIIIPYYQQWADKMIIFEWSIIIDKDVSRWSNKTSTLELEPVLGKVTFKSNALQYCVTP